MLGVLNNKTKLGFFCLSKAFAYLPPSNIFTFPFTPMTEWSFRDDEGETHGFYDTDTMKSWLEDGYVGSDTEVQRRADTERGVEDFEWLGMVDELIDQGYTQESSWYYMVEPEGEEHGPFGLYILRAWITEEMLDYETLLAKCCGAGALHQHKEQQWQEAGHFDEFTLLCEIEGVFGGGEEEEEEEEEQEEQEEQEGEEKQEDPERRASFKRATMETGNIVGGTSQLDRSQLQGETAADRNKEFFEKMKEEKERKEQKDIEIKEAKLASMSEEERVSFLASEQAQLKHDKDKAKMLKKQMKKFGKKKGGKKGRRTTKHML